MSLRRVPLRGLVSSSNLLALRNPLILRSCSFSSSSFSSSNYTELLKTLVTINMDRKIKLGVETTGLLQKAMGDSYSDKSYVTIHVGGTNGKGSVSTKIASVLEKSGLKVGLFTSPHLSSFRERIRVNGKLISENEIEQLLPPLLETSDRKGLNATFFELTTLLAFAHFAAQKVDVCVLEVGLGGRGDSTTTCNPSVSVLTSVALDHTHILGDTIDKILVEKAGIIKPNIPVVVGPRIPLPIIEERCESLNAPLVQVDPLAMNYHDLEDINAIANPSYDVENEAIAQTVIQTLTHPSHPHFTSFPQLTIDPAVLTTALETGLGARPPCRFESVWVESQTSQTKDETGDEKGSSQSRGRKVEVILDVGHNADALGRLAQLLSQTLPPNTPVRVVLGLSRGRNGAECARDLMKLAGNLHLVQSDSKRSLSVQELLDDLDAQTGY